MNIGIDKFGLAIPKFFLDIRDLAVARNENANKFLKGLLQLEMSVSPVTQDIVTLGATAAHEFLTEEDKKKIDKKSQLTQISWNNFIFNFNNSHIFYPLNDLVFFNADFQGAKFYKNADFSDSRFHQETQFTKSKFFSCHPFKGAEFYGNTYFNKSQFNPPGNLKKISEVFEKLSNSGPVNQHDNNLTEGYTFFRSTFYEVVSFQKAHFYTNESINQSSFKKDVDFQESIFDGTEAFIETSFSVKPNFKDTLFSYLIPDIFNNSIPQESKELNNGIATLLQDNKMFLSRKELPVGARLFDPSSWNSTDKKYDRISHSAL